MKLKTNVKSALKVSLTGLVLSGAATIAVADITVGVTVSATGPAASLGIPEKNTVALMPKTVGGKRSTTLF